MLGIFENRVGVGEKTSFARFPEEWVEAEGLPTKITGESSKLPGVVWSQQFTSDPRFGCFELDRNCDLEQQPHVLVAVCLSILPTDDLTKINERVAINEQNSKFLRKSARRCRKS